MRVALIQSSKEKRAAFVEKPYIPGALLSLASYLKGQGFSPQIIDLNMFSLGKKISSNFFKKAAQRILRDKPEALCFSVMCNTFPASLLIAKECKRYARDIPIIFGGPEVSFEEAEVLETFGQVDVIVRGEGELTVTELLHAIKNNLSFDNICGITFRKKNTIVRNSDRPFIENLDDLPGLDFSLLPHPEKYGLGAIEAGRGCPFRCTFCSTCRMWKRKFRMKSPQKLADDLRRADATFKKYGFMNISVVHDHFLASSKRAEEFLSLIEGDGISWSCYSRLEALNERLIIKLKKAGCRMIFLGIESGSAEIQKKIGKNLPLSTLPEKLELLNKHGIFSELSFIIGFPDESLEQMNQTLLLALRSKLYAPFSSVQIYFLTLLKGSELYAQEKGRFRDNVFQETGGLSPLITDLPQELALIKKYPHIFPSFYYLNNGAIMLAELQAIRNLFTYCIEFYPLTTMLLLEKLSITPLELGRRVGG
ncbi:MAG: radical SAM protein, partial [Candidatus Margulisiibacteriota bacterium]